MSARYKTGFWVLSFGLWVYIILRAIYSPFVFDEATTFLLYVHNNKIIPGDAFWSANNHILNTALTWISYQLLGPEEWQLRLPNVMAFPAFCYYLYKISLKLKDLSSRLLLVFGVFSGHIFLEMFGFSRGYGLSFAALAGAIYYGLNNLNEDILKNRVGLYLCNLLMLLANLTLLPISLALAALTLNYSLWNGRTKNQISGNFIFFGIPIGLAAFLSFQLKAKGELYYAADNGFWGGSIKSLLQAFWFGDGQIYQIGLVTILILFLFLLWRNFKKKTIHKTAIFNGLLFITPFLFYPLAKLFFNVEYPLDRALLYVPFLLILSLAFALEFSQISILAKSLVLAIVVGPFLYSFGSNTSLKKATGFKWNTEQIPDAFFEKLAENKGTVGGYFLRRKCWEYLNIKSVVKANVLQISDYPGNTSDYQIINDYDLRLFEKDYTKVLTDRDSELLFMERKNKRMLQDLISQSESKDLKNHPGFSKFQEIQIDTMFNPLRIDFRGTLKSKANPFNGLLAIAVIDHNGEQLLYEEIRLRNLYLEYGEQQEISQSIYFAGDNSARVLKVLFWNKDDQDFEMKSFETSVYSSKVKE